MSPNTATLKIVVIHGPNLNLLGLREPDIYGRTTLADIDADLKVLGRRLGLEVDTFQSNHEGALVEKVQSAREACQALIINPAAYGHTSVALRDALLLLAVPIIEVHLSNIHQREDFRHRTMIADVVTGQICGLGAQGYRLALKACAHLIGGSTSPEG